ncbi:glycoside hydrolase family 16 protein [Streptacidiphilus sp. PB12-B1b]|uniref:glycoside hydrolase family 16 protein n=1 Tax=Streptacidiphilus sp. PB12-B1b TaxID=2705012 RepID=UPI0015FCFE05|nr:glycoside hydrolase family 16 protein [Streptacidiphilus sp. PB12-B1b]QMU76503.1 glycoside hydrolase family 16 protein [Streptacidiphilus sp. PB12-B1b]
MPALRTRSTRPRIHRLLTGLIGVTAVMGLLTVAGPGVTAAQADPPTDSYPPAGYSSVFVDNFSGSSLDTSVWNDRQTAQSNDSNVSVSGGELHVNMERVSTSTGLDGYRGGGISSKQYFGYGYYEVRAFVPAGLPGWHPAFWTQIWDGGQAQAVYNTDFTELDVLENQPTTVAGVKTTYLDAGDFAWDNNAQGADVQLSHSARVKWQPTASSPSPLGSWHTFGLLYTATSLTYTLDGKQVGSPLPNPSLPDSPMSLWLTAIPTNAADLDSSQPVGHSYGTFDVDWVAYYAPGGVTPTTTPDVSSVPADTPAVTQDFSDNAHEWTTDGVGSWTVTSSGGVDTYGQSSTSGDAISTFGLPTNDLPYVPTWSNTSVEGTLTLDSTGAGAGLLGRYQNDENYYYLQLNPTTQQVSLVKKTDPGTGATVTTLASAPLAIATGTPYDLKLTIKDDTLTGYVDGTQVVTADDSTFITGGVGVKGYHQSFGVSGVQIDALG